MKWRKVKKRFKKNKGKYKGMTVIAQTEGNVSLDCKKQFTITDVKIFPAGGKKIDFEFTAEPSSESTSLLPNEWKDADVAKEQGAFSKGFDISFDMPLETPSPQLLKILKGL